jgi:perosamine synthetase
MRDFIPQIEPWIDGSELAQLKRVIDSTYVTEYKLTEEFENLIKDLTGAKYAISTTNGTAALFCCLKALNIGEGDEVIVPNITFIASANAVIMANATPVICEINNKNFCIDTNEIESLITNKTKAIMPVHLYGQSCDMESIQKIADKHNLKVIEDAAQGVGVQFNSKHVGTFGDLGILSFYGNKTITCGEGGVVLTGSKELRDRVYQLKNHGRLLKGKFEHESVGFNFAFTEMQAAIGISQLHKLQKIISRKKQIYDKYQDKFKHLKGKLDDIYVDSRCKPVWWFTSFLTSAKTQLKKYLSDKNIQTRDFFYPLHMQPCYNNEEVVFKKNGYQNSEKIYNTGISLPSSYILSDEEQDYIIDTILQFYG